ncbi:MAG TPA: flagellar biosynthetic protein FliO [Polyangiaceae bacterium]
MTPLRQYVSAAVFGAGLALAAASAHAEEGPDASLKGPAWLAPHSGPKLAHPVASGPSVGLGRSVGVLLLTSVLGGTALYLRSRKNKPTKARLTQLRVLGSTKLGGRANLVLAEVAGRKILLGVTDSSVRKLGWLEPDAEEEELLTPAARPRLVAAGVDLAARPPRTSAEPVPAAPKRSFRDFLASAVGNLGAPAADDSAASILAAETQDTFTRAAPRSPEVRRTEPTRKLGNPQMLDVEGQARGLLARLGEPRA